MQGIKLSWSFPSIDTPAIAQVTRLWSQPWKEDTVSISTDYNTYILAITNPWLTPLLKGLSSQISQS